MLHILAEATRRGEVCAVVDTDDNFHPASAAEAGVELDRLVWVRCLGNTEHAMRAADLLLHAGGMGVVALDLCEVSTRVLNRIPLSYWFRFQRAIEGTPSILMVTARASQARSCAAHVMELERKRTQWSGCAPFQLLEGLEASACFHRPAKWLVQKLVVKRGSVPTVEDAFENTVEKWSGGEPALPHKRTITHCVA
jgi:hypothetical protein